MLRSSVAGILSLALVLGLAAPPLRGQDAPRDGMGITEHVADIMRRGGGLPAAPRQHRKLRIHPPRPAVAERSAVAVPEGEFVLPKSPQTTGTSFLASSTAESLSIYPLDAMGAVGPTQILLCTNALIKVFDRTGTLQSSVLDTPSDNFFASVRTSGTSVTDVRVRFDITSQRWFVMALDGDVPNPPKGTFPGANNHFVLAVSSGATITSSSSFTFFRFTAGTPTLQADSDAVGIDCNALYIGVSEFDSTPNFINSSAFVVQKSSVLGAGPLVVTSFANLATEATPNDPIVGTYLPSGVDNNDPAATVGYFVGPDISNLWIPAFCTTLRVHRVLNPGSTSPTLDAVQVVTVPAFGETYEFDSLNGVPVKGSNPGLDDIDWRVTCAQIQGGQLWTVHNIDVDASGNATFTPTRDGSRWYAIGGIGPTSTATLAQSGTLFDASANGSSCFVPSLAVSAQGHMAICATRGGPSEYATAVAAGRLLSDPPGTTQAATVLAAGTASYNYGSYDPKAQVLFRRWGDYTYTCVDPTDLMTMWTFQEFANATDSMGIQVSQLLAPPPATASQASPASANSGQASVTVTLTGVSSSGSEFFDPGTAFPNLKHLGASVSGGVTVNSATYVDPLHVTLDLNTTAAVPGPVSITITNPDGQSTTATGVFTVTVPGGAAATVTGLTSTLAPGTYGAGQVIPVQVAFSSVVTVTGGTPTLALNVMPSQTATYASGSGTAVLTFTYTVAAGDSSAALDAASTQALMAGGATISSAGGAAVLTLPAPGSAESLPPHDALDISAPVPTSASSSHHSSGCGALGLEAALVVLAAFACRARPSGAPLPPKA